MAKRARKSYTEAQRKQILETAIREDLTAEQVKKRFSVTPVTFYSWRKKAGIVGKRGRRPKVRVAGAAASIAGGGVAAQLRAGVQSRVREILPGIVREEVSRYLDELFAGSAPRRRRGRPRKQA